MAEYTLIMSERYVPWTMEEVKLSGDVYYVKGGKGRLRGLLCRWIGDCSNFIDKLNSSSIAICWIFNLIATAIRLRRVSGSRILSWPEEIKKEYCVLPHP